MEKNEIITLVISSFALIISLIGLYYQFFWKHSKAYFRLVRIAYPDNEFNMELSYVVCNFGNIDLLLNDVEFVSGLTDKGTGIEPYSVLKYYCNDFPSIIEPEKIKQVFISIKSEDLKNRKKNLYTMFEFISAKGKKQEFLHNISHLGEHHSKDEQKTWKRIRIRKFNE